MTAKNGKNSAALQKKPLLKSALDVAMWIFILTALSKTMLRKKWVSQAMFPLILLALLLMSASCTQAQTTELLTNSGFEGTYTEIAPNWSDNSWGDPYPSFRYKRETVNAHSGTSAQRLQVNSFGGGKVQFVQPYTFLKNHSYQASVWLRSSGSIPVKLILRRAGAPYEDFAVKTIQVGSNWQQVTIKGSFDSDVPGYFIIVPQQTGTVWIDDATLIDDTAASSTSVVLRSQIPKTYFGLHINCLGCFNTWPAISSGTLRLWDMGARWQEIEPSNDSWQWNTMDYYVNSAYKNGQSMIYTLGVTPQWASARPNETAIYGSGAAAEPANLDDWRDYVRTVATRYKGKIKYYEIWNEVNQPEFYTGSVDKMLELTRTAKEVLKAVDPSIKVISPNVTSIGMDWMDEFLFKGGGNQVDIIGWHWYFGLRPEQILPLVNNTRRLMKSYNIANKPLYNTEGASGKDSTYQPTDDEIRGSVARAYILFWSHGISNFNWYMWDRYGADCIPLSQDSRVELRPGGIAYREVVKWLKGAQITSKSVDSNNTWLIEIKRANGYVGHILWNPEKKLNWSIPSDWGIVRRRDLTGTSTDKSSVPTTQIGPAPILLENQTSVS
jgi:hypothetical protein